MNGSTWLSAVQPESALPITAVQLLILITAAVDGTGRNTLVCGLFPYGYGTLWVWYGMVRYGTVWYGMVWVWYGMVWYVMVRYGMVWHGMVWYGMGRYGIVVVVLTLTHNTMQSVVGYGMAWYGMVWYSMLWVGTVLYDITGSPLVSLGKQPFDPTFCDKAIRNYAREHRYQQASILVRFDSPPSSAPAGSQVLILDVDGTLYGQSSGVEQQARHLPTWRKGQGVADVIVALRRPKEPLVLSRYFFGLLLVVP